MRQQTEIYRLYAAAGWKLSEGRGHAGQGLWLCPCGNHIAPVSVGKGIDTHAKQNTIATIRRCAKAIEALEQMAVTQMTAPPVPELEVEMKEPPPRQVNSARAKQAGMRFDGLGGVIREALSDHDNGRPFTTNQILNHGKVQRYLDSVRIEGVFNDVDWAKLTLAKVGQTLSHFSRHGMASKDLKVESLHQSRNGASVWNARRITQHTVIAEPEPEPEPLPRLDITEPVIQVTEDQMSEPVALTFGDTLTVIGIVDDQALVRDETGQLYRLVVAHLR